MTYALWYCIIDGRLAFSTCLLTPPVFVVYPPLFNLLPPDDADGCGTCISAVYGDILEVRLLVALGARSLYTLTSGGRR